MIIIIVTQAPENKTKRIRPFLRPLAEHYSVWISCTGGDHADDVSAHIAHNNVYIMLFDSKDD